MAVQRYALVDDATSVVTNVVMWSGDTADWQPPPGQTAILDEPPTASPGWLWDGETFTPPPPP